MPRSELGHLIDSGPRERLLLEDPLTGRDVAAGSYRIAAVQAAFRKAARRLEQLASTHHNSSSGSSNGGGGKHGSSSRINYLEGLFNVQRVLSRDGKGFKGSGGKGLGLMDGGGVLAEEYYVLGRGGNYTVSNRARCDWEFCMLCVLCPSTLACPAPESWCVSSGVQNWHAS